MTYTFLGLAFKWFQHLHPTHSQNRRFKIWQYLHMECNEFTVTQYMKIYGSIHIHCSHELTAYLNNLQFMQVWNYHLWADLVHPWGSKEPHHSSCIVNIPHDNTIIIFWSKWPFFPHYCLHFNGKHVNKHKIFSTYISHNALKQIFTRLDLFLICIYKK